MMNKDGDSDGAVWRASIELAEAVASGVSSIALGQALMTALGRLVDCDLGSIVTTRPGERSIVAGEISDTSLIRDNYWRYARELTPDELTRHAAGFIRETDLFPQQRRRAKLALFHEFLGPSGLKNLVTTSWVADGRVWAVGLTRSSVSFSERDTAQLNALLPHLRAALRATEWLTELRRDAYPAQGSGGPWGLSPMQERVMALAIRGLTNKEVAALLGSSPNTVRNTLVEVFKKVGVSRRSELAFIVQSGCTEADPVRIGKELAQQRALVAMLERRGAA